MLSCDISPSTPAITFFAGGSGGAFRSTNDGGNWTATNSALTDTDVRALVVNSRDYIFAGTVSGMVFPSAQSTTAVREITKVYNVLGEEIATLVAENLFAGKHQVHCNADSDNFKRKIRSGAYFYRLLAGNIVQMQKLILFE